MKDSLQESAPTFFIIGLPRSGTTLLETIMDSHSEIAVSPEIFSGRILWRLNIGSTISDRWKSLLLINAQYKLSSHFLSPIRKCIAKQALRVWEFPIKTQAWYAPLHEEYVHIKKAKIFGEKTPENTNHLKTLTRAFPCSKYILILRNPFDITLSITEVTSLKLGNAITDLFLLRSAIFVKRGLHELYLKKRLANKESLCITYEDLVTSSEGTMENICKFLGLDYEQQMLNFRDKKKFTIGNKILETIHANLKRPITSEQVDRSFRELSAEQITLLHKYLTPEINYLPYKYNIDKVPLSLKNRLRLINAKLAFHLRWYMLEELKNKFRFQLHHFAIRYLRNTPLKSYIFKNLICKDQDWNEILSKSELE